MRLDKWLSNLQYGSRKQIDRAARDGRITLNGAVVSEASIHVDPKNDTVTFDGAPVVFIPDLTLMMNKRAGVVCAHHDTRFQTVFDDLPLHYARHDLHMAGRLDRDVTGFLLLSVEGALIHRIISPHKQLYKTYHVQTEAPVDNLARFNEPLILKDGRGRPYTIAPPRVVDASGTTTVIQIAEGKHHQVKRMFAAIGHPIIKLTRTAIGGLTLDPDLQEGAVKQLTPEDIARIFA
ncbi:MAG: rRNA pseudouridine synthase [Acholeplasmatales bacterium]|nr:MAG: rRNA pseudouridine synthase [Acholeplasmatales bacterium]